MFPLEKLNQVRKVYCLVVRAAWGRPYASWIFLFVAEAYSWRTPPSTPIPQQVHWFHRLVCPDGLCKGLSTVEKSCRFLACGGWPGRDVLWTPGQEGWLFVSPVLCEESERCPSCHLQLASPAEAKIVVILAKQRQNSCVYLIKCFPSKRSSNLVLEVCIYHEIF